MPTELEGKEKWLCDLVRKLAKREQLYALQGNYTYDSHTNRISYQRNHIQSINVIAFIRSHKYLSNEKKKTYISLWKQLSKITCRTHTIHTSVQDTDSERFVFRFKDYVYDVANVLSFLAFANFKSIEEFKERLVVWELLGEKKIERNMILEVLEELLKETLEKKVFSMIEEIKRLLEESLSTMVLTVNQELARRKYIVGNVR